MYSLHDMSRVELGKNKLPRFNMPFEAGIAYTVHAMQPQRRTHHMGVLDAKAYQYQASISDLAGLDPKIHNNDPAEAIACVREFLRRKSCRTDLPGAAHVQRRYLAFQAALPKGARAGKRSVSELKSELRQRPAGPHGRLDPPEPGLILASALGDPAGSMLPI